jgi:hypothetical protein
MLLLVALIAISLLAAIQWLVPRLIQNKLQATVAAHLDAKLTIGDVVYRPPYTVRLYDVHFIAHPARNDGGTQLVSATEIDLSLARLPLSRGPLVIESLNIDGLNLQLLRTADGHLAGLDLAGPPSQPAGADARMKLSDVLRLRHFRLRDASVRYRDLADASSSSMVWRGIRSDMTLTPQSNALYAFSFSAADDPLASLSIDGKLDVDSLNVELSQMTMAVQTPDANSGLTAEVVPAPLRQAMDRFHVRGKLQIVASGSVPLKQPDHAALRAMIDLADGGAITEAAKLDDLSFAVRLAVAPPVDARTAPLKATLQSLHAVSGNAKLNMAGAQAAFYSDGRWHVSGITAAVDAAPSKDNPLELAGHADLHADIAHDPATQRTPTLAAIDLIGLHLRPPDPDTAAIDGLSGNIRFSGSDPTDRRIELRDIAARYGADKLRLTHALVTLDKFPQRIDIPDIAAHVDFGPYSSTQPSPSVPGDLGPILQGLSPSGPFDIAGTAALLHVIRVDGPGYSPQWNLNISTDGGALSLLDGSVPVTALKGSALVTKRAFRIPQLTGTLYSGAASLTGSARVVEPIAYDGELDVANASVEQFAQAMHLPSTDGKTPTGSAHLKLKVFSTPPDPTTSTATGPATASENDLDEWLALFAADGKLQIDNGDLWALPVLKGATGHTRVAREALTAGEAAAVFSIAHRTVYLKHVAVYSPALGLQGSGSETFAGNLDLDLIAAPLGDWKRKLAETDIPIFSTILSSAAGTIERVIGNATSELLYHFHVTGTRSNPIIQTIPAPFLTDSAANLFSRMLHPDGNSKLVDEVNQK